MFDGGTPRLTVPAPPDSFLQLVQWQKLRVSGGSSTSKATAPQRQLPRMALTRPSLYIAATFLAAAAYEVAVALRWIAMPLEPGADPTGQGVVLVAVLAAIAATLVVAWFRPRDGFFAIDPARGRGVARCPLLRLRCVLPAVAPALLGLRLGLAVLGLRRRSRGRRRRAGEPPDERSSGGGRRCLRPPPRRHGGRPLAGSIIGPWPRTAS